MCDEVRNNTCICTPQAETEDGKRRAKKNGTKCVMN